MFETTVEAVAATSKSKVDYMKSCPRGYFIASMVAGFFISLGSFVSMSAGGYCGPLMGPAAKLVSAIAFASALSLVIMAGCELFTGNNMVVGLGALVKRTTWRDCFLLWAFCWLGNLAGSWLAIAMFHFGGADTPELVAKSFASVAAVKCSYGVVALILRGILCNMLVCLAVWCAARMKEETAKLIMVVWCIFIFMVCGFEHSVANMSIVGVALINPAAADVTLGGYCNNLFWVTIGNILGGLAFVAWPYVLMVQKKN